MYLSTDLSSIVFRASACKGVLHYNLLLCKKSGPKLLSSLIIVAFKRKNAREKSTFKIYHAGIMWNNWK